jgi:hypothetical protein
MNGQYSIRGYLIQALVAVLDSLNEDDNWSSVCIEPNDESEKVDILWYYGDGRKKVSQVKSSINQFSPAMAKKWAKDLEDGTSDAFEYDLYLVGRLDDKLFSQKDKLIGKVKIRTADADINNLNAQILNRIGKFFYNNGRNQINTKIRELLSFSLSQRFIENSAFGRQLTKLEFNQVLLDYLSGIEAYLERSPFSLLMPNEPINSKGINYNLIKNIQHLIGWFKLNENEKVTIYNERLDKDEDFIVDFWGNYESRLKDNETDFIYINGTLEPEYPSNIQNIIQQNACSVDLIRDRIIKIDNAYTEHSIDFILSTKESELSFNYIDEIKNFYKSSFLNKDIIYYILDNQKTTFLVSSIITAQLYRDNLAVKFLYPITEDTSSEKKIGKRGICLPPQYINSSIIPIIKENREKISILLFCSDSYSKDRLRKLIWLLIRLTSGLGNEYQIYFPDYTEEHLNEVNEVIRSYQDDELSQKLSVKRLFMCETNKLGVIPKPQNHQLLDEEFEETKNEIKKIKIKPHLIEYLPYGDNIKPFLDSEFVTSQDLKIFLSKKGIFLKTADKKKIIHLMTSLLFSPAEIESLVEFVTVKDKTMNNSTKTYTLLANNNINRLIEKESFNFNEIGKDLGISLLSEAKVKRSEKNRNEFVVEVLVEHKNPNKQAMVSSTYSTACVTICPDKNDSKLDFDKSYNSRTARIIAERIVKVIADKLLSKDVIEDDMAEVAFSNFNNKERVNFLLSYTNIESSNILNDYNTKSFKYMFDETQNLPPEYQDKIGKEYVTQSKGKNLEGIKELVEDSFKDIIYCEEISISYKFNIRGVSGNYYVILNFSDALKNKNILDGIFQFQGKVYLNTRNKEKIKSIDAVEKELKQEFKRLINEKLKQFKKI